MRCINVACTVTSQREAQFDLPVDGRHNWDSLYALNKAQMAVRIKPPATHLKTCHSQIDRGRFKHVSGQSGGKTHPISILMLQRSSPVAGFFNHANTTYNGLIECKFNLIHETFPSLEAVHMGVQGGGQWRSYPFTVNWWLIWQFFTMFSLKVLECTRTSQRDDSWKFLLLQCHLQIVTQDQ